MNINQQLQHLKAQGLTPVSLDNPLTLLPVQEQQKLFIQTLNSCNHIHFSIQIFPAQTRWPETLTTTVTRLFLPLISKNLPTPTLVTTNGKDIHYYYNTTSPKNGRSNLKDFITEKLQNLETQYNLLVKTNFLSSSSYTEHLPGFKCVNSDFCILLFSIYGTYTPSTPNMDMIPHVPIGVYCNSCRNLDLIQSLPCISELGAHSGRHKLLFAFYGIAKTIFSKNKATKMAIELNYCFKIPLSNYEILHQLNRVDQHRPNGYCFSDFKLVDEFLPITFQEAHQHGFLNHYIKKQQFESSRRMKEDRNKRIEELFNAGNSYSEISKILKNEGFKNCSLATIKRVLASIGANRYNSHKNSIPECTCQKAHFFDQDKAPATSTLYTTICFDDFNLQKNTWITGLAGAGKTTLLFAICAELKKQKKRILITAAYGIAAQHAGGDTISHSLAIDSSVIWEYNSSLTLKDLKPLLNIDVLVIDEIGTCRPDIFTRIVQLIAKLQQDYQHHVQLIVVGDFLQLPSFYKNDDVAAYAHTHSLPLNYRLWKTDAWNHTIEQVIYLEGSCRTEDKDFHTALSNIAMRTNLSEAINYINEHALVNRKAKSLLERMDATYLAAHRNDIEKVNLKYIEKHKNDNSFTCLKGTLSHDTPGAIFKVEPTIPVWLGMRVMTIKNGKNYKNGTRGVITKITNRYLEMSCCNQIIKIYKRTFLDENHSPATLIQFPIVPAYGITIHKAQGLTLGKVVLNPSTFASGQLYTALSRVRNVQDLVLTRKIVENDISIDTHAVGFMKKTKKDAIILSLKQGD